MYSKKVEEKLRGFGAAVGDRIRIGDKEGTLMPRMEGGDSDCIVLKLDNGYNIGIEYTSQAIEKLAGKTETEIFPAKKVEFDKGKPIVAIVATGGTIASRVDYRTGGVVPAKTASDLASAIPELAEIANIRCTSVLSIFSEDMRPEHYKLIAGAIAKEIEDGAVGIVVLHGTDTMHYTSAVLSFMLRELPVPVVLVGAQRSSDRGSSDAAMNLICGVGFAANADCSGVYVCMHKTLDDKLCHVHSGTRVRKMHTSRRDAFRSIDRTPVATVDSETGAIEFMGEHQKRGGSKFEVASALEMKVGFLKSYPGMGHEQVAFFTEKGYKGLVIEGTGLGHMPVNGDDNSNENSLVLKEIERLAGSGCVIVMTSQCIYGNLNMDIYSTGRDLQKAGVVPGAGMLPEVAYVKLMWLLGNFGAERAREMIPENIAGEIVERRRIAGDFEAQG